MQTITTSLHDAGRALLEGIATLLGDSTPLHDINESFSSGVIIGPHYAFHPLPLDKKRLQSRLGSDRDHFVALIRALLRVQPDAVRRRIDQHDKTIREVIEQTHCVWYSTSDKAMAAARQAVEEILDAVSCLYDPAEDSVVLIPDTNALVLSPAFQAWGFDGIAAFEILLVPMVLSELDALKREHRNPAVREKANGVIRQIKEYRRRGALSDGVVIVADRIHLRAVAAEPRVDDILPWLDHASADDRILASCIEAMRNHPRSKVALVTGDINLQNKAGFARVPFLEPPIIDGSEGDTDD